MQRVTGLGGVFVKSEDPDRLYSWYEHHLGVKREPGGGVLFKWRDEQDPEKRGMTVFSIFKKDSPYFDPSRAQFMLNFRVDDLDRLLRTLKAQGVAVDDRREVSEFGRFGWITDPEGNRIELWEPPSDNPHCY